MFKHSVCGVQKENGSSNVIDFSDGFALNNLLQELGGGTYGSVTKEYERMHAERMRVMTFLSAYEVAKNSSVPGIKPCQSGLSPVNLDIPSSIYKSDNVITRDSNSVTAGPVDKSAQEPHGLYYGRTNYHSTNSKFNTPNSCCFSGIVDHKPEYKGGTDQNSVIVLDSDEENDHERVKVVPRKLEEGSSNILARLESRLKEARKTPDNRLFNQIVTYESSYAKAHDFSGADWRPSLRYEKVQLQPALGCENAASASANDYKPIQHLVGDKHISSKYKQAGKRKRGETTVISHTENKKEEPDGSLTHESSFDIQDPFNVESYDNDLDAPKTDGLEDLWKDMSLAMECSRTTTSDVTAMHNEKQGEELEEEQECDHSFLLQDDIGLVCRICGVIRKSIETIFDNQWVKGTRLTRNSMHRSRNSKDPDDATEYCGPKLSGDFIAAEIFIHPRHMKQMKPHQIEGFNFLVRNLVTDKPGGCILAHAPGSGKTFMLISFIQSFLAKYPFARPLVVLPKGIVPTWKKEFQRWQVEDIPLYDFYSLKADNRSQQLEVLKKWEEIKSILFLGYKQFANIISSNSNSKIDLACQERLLKVPSLLIIDEGHTPRNEDTDVLTSLAKVQTTRKVVLSGTLFQNHVKEVFNILNLVRPKFLSLDISRIIVKRVLSRVYISGGSRMHINGDKFLDLVEDTLRNDDNYKRKVAVIQDLRELTQNVLHYYRGDFLEELPGLVDFTVLLKLTNKQKQIIQKLEKSKRVYLGKFKKSSVGSAIFLHPHLQNVVENSACDRVNVFNDAKVDEMLDSLDMEDGVKTKFFVNILSMAEAAGEKLLAFSQYLIPMKFLERLIVKLKGWRVGKEIFMITGDSSAEEREWSMDQFNNSPDAKVLLGSIKACGEGISLVGASRVVILDVHLNPSVTRQAIGRAFRPGQEKKVYTYRLVAAESQEEEDHFTSFRKELMSKMWFEWSEHSGHHDFELQEVDVASCEDAFLESPILAEDVKVLYRR